MKFKFTRKDTDNGFDDFTGEEEYFGGFEDEE